MSERMVKLSKEPYNNPELVGIYEERYNLHKTQLPDVSLEMTTIQEVAESYSNPSWCDFACGTSYHLRKVEGSFERTGIDRSELMINQHRSETDFDINYVVSDILDWDTDDKFDIVTNFWFGYTHQPTLDDVLSFFRKMIHVTKEGGSIVLSYHDNWGLFESIPRVSPEPMGGFFNFDAIQWSYKEPSTGDVYKCISPHKDLIIDTFKEYFTNIRREKYSVQAGKELLILEGRKWK